MTPGYPGRNLEWDAGEYASGVKQAAEKLEDWGEVDGIKIAGAEAHADLIGFIGTTEVVPCYSAPREGLFPQPVKPRPILEILRHG